MPVLITLFHFIHHLPLPQQRDVLLSCAERNIVPGPVCQWFSWIALACQNPSKLQWKRAGVMWKAKLDSVRPQAYCTEAVYGCEIQKIQVSSKMNVSNCHKYTYGWMFWNRYGQYFPGGGNIPRGRGCSSAELFYNAEDVSEDNLCSPGTIAMPGCMHRGSPCAQKHLHGKGWDGGRKNDRLIPQNPTLLLPAETTLFFPVQKGARSTYVSSR